MTAKEYIKQANILIRRIKRKRLEAQETRIRESCPSSPSYSDMPKTASLNPNQQSENFSRAAELDEEANKAFAELEELKKQFKQVIRTIDNPDDRDLIFKRYIEFKKWEIIAKELGYSESHTKRMHSSILKKMILDDTQ